MRPSRPYPERRPSVVVYTCGSICAANTSPERRAVGHVSLIIVITSSPGPERSQAEHHPAEHPVHPVEQEEAKHDLHAGPPLLRCEPLLCQRIAPRIRSLADPPREPLLCQHVELY